MSDGAVAKLPILVLNQDGETTRKGKVEISQPLSVLMGKLRLNIEEQYFTKKGGSEKIDPTKTAAEVSR